MSDIDLDAVRDRYCRALDAKPGKGPITHVDWLTDSVCDIPDLLREVERLTRLLGSHTDGHRCTCTVLTGIQRDSSGAPVSPPEWEQDPWCPTHPDVDLIRAEFDRRTDERDKCAWHADHDYLRALDAEKERDEAEAEADRLRGLLAEAEHGRADAWDRGYVSGAWRTEMKAQGCAVTSPANPYRGQQ